MRPVFVSIFFFFLVATKMSYADNLAAQKAFEAGDHKTAISEWEADAKKGEPSAYHGLGRAFNLGLGVEKDLEQAV